MSLFHVSAVVGDVVKERTVPLGRLDPTVRGTTLRCVTLYVSEERPKNSDRYWVMTLGTLLEPNRFNVKSERLLTEGLAEGLTAFAFDPPLPYAAGEYPTVRLRSFGGAGPLSDLTLIAEFGIEGDDERATR